MSRHALIRLARHFTPVTKLVIGWIDEWINYVDEDDELFFIYILYITNIDMGKNVTHESRPL